MIYSCNGFVLKSDTLKIKKKICCIIILATLKLKQIPIESNHKYLYFGFICNSIYLYLRENLHFSKLCFFVFVLYLVFFTLLSYILKIKPVTKLPYYTPRKKKEKKI